jgi:hypothetical protein
MARAVLTPIVFFACTSLAAQTAPSRAVPDRTWWLSGQLNVIYQWHPAFHAAYTEPTAFGPQQQRLGISRPVLILVRIDATDPDRALDRREPAHTRIRTRA